ncbi:MAG TPA: aminotransferase class III-fold pyridoxal phosphate-dependent enzyme [Actinomycetota bacterium]|nr:aminotransferase class III-fold pyridoxal phosphate-dependent enzyme [Actinomycetota bacterium]
MTEIDAIDGDVLRGEPPTFDPEAAAALAADLFGVHGTASPLGSERDQGFAIVGADGPVGVLKISNAGEDRAIVDMETAAALHVLSADPALPVAAPLAVAGADPTLGPASFAAVVVGPSGASHLVRAFAFMPGAASIDPLELDAEALHDYGVTVARLGRAMRSFFHPSAGRVLLWDVQHALLLRPMADAIEDPVHRRLVDMVLDRFERHVVPAWPRLRSQVIHGDVTLDNALVDERGRISGIIDFGDMSHSALVCDLAAALESLLAGHEPADVVPMAMRFIDGYRSVTPLEPEELQVLPDLLSARLVTVAVLFGWRARRHPDNSYLRGWEERLWPLLASLEDDGGARLRERLRAHPVPADDADLTARRVRVFGPALSPLTYDRPLHLGRGDGVWLFDTDGNRYLDCYNNVPVVGHCHPRVAEAIAQQSRLLNTNMRYLHDASVELGERLVASMPPGSGLDTVLFVNSGSEANDTAWRLATIATGGGGGLVTAFAYHGVTQAISDLSPEEWRGGYHPSHVELFEALDPYRDTTSPQEAAAALTRAAERLAQRGVVPAIAFVDGGFTSDGILAPPAAYVRGLAERTRDVGALYVADEVQVGHGRGGAGLWSFAGAGVVPDVVTMGKPMGNGHPVAALVTRRELTERLAETTEWFSTFGGNPVACAAALAVLDVIEDQRLVEQAGRIGPALRTALTELAATHPAIGDVRGLGLLTGVELVRDAETGEPDADLADAVKNGLRARGVLVGTTGHRDNVLKVRPPLVFNEEHIPLVVEALDDALVSLGR